MEIQTYYGIKNDLYDLSFLLSSGPNHMGYFLANSDGGSSQILVQFDPLKLKSAPKWAHYIYFGGEAMLSLEFGREE